MRTCRKKIGEEIAEEQKCNTGHGDDSKKDGDRSMVWIDTGVHGVRLSQLPLRNGMVRDARFAANAVAVYDFSIGLPLGCV